MVSRSVLEHTGQFDHWGDYIPQPAIIDSDAAAIQTCWLNQFSALKISGPDAERFLQGQLTCNVIDITTSTAHYGACCTAKGRIVANFNMSFDGENYWLIMPSSSAEVLEKHLQKYKVFFKASIENCQQSHLILGQWHTAEAGTAQHHTDQHQIALTNNRSFIIVKDASSQTYNFSPTLNWRQADINEGVYYVEAAQTEQWIPQHINWHLINGISFNKGCYTGQEIIARLQYLGKAKKSLYHYQVLTEQEITSEQLNAQQLVDHTGKVQAEILLIRNTQKPLGSIDLLAVSRGENPLPSLYFNDSMDSPLTLQNLPYTIAKDA